MTPRISAGELEARYKLKHQLYDFFDKMFAEMMRNLPEKGFSWRMIGKAQLKKLLKRHLNAGNWLDVANFCFMLDDLEQGASST